MTAPASSARAFEVRHLQIARALFAAIAAVMVTFSPDHSAVVGLAVFSGFAIATGLVFVVAAWLVYPAGQRTAVLLLAAATLVAGMVAGIGPWRTTEMFFIVVIAWALVTGAIELVAGLRSRRSEAPPAAPRDTITVGIVTLALAVGVAVVSPQYALDYYVDEAKQSFTLTGTVIAVGVFGAYAAIVAVYLAIAGFSPRRDSAPTPKAEVRA